MAIECGLREPRKPPDRPCVLIIQPDDIFYHAVTCSRRCGGPWWSRSSWSGVRGSYPRQSDTNNLNCSAWLLVKGSYRERANQSGCNRVVSQRQCQGDKVGLWVAPSTRRNKIFRTGVLRSLRSLRLRKVHHYLSERRIRSPVSRAGTNSQSTFLSS